MTAALLPPRAAYIHVPFCVHRCGYCDFTLVAGRDDLVDKYLAALARELESLEQPRSVDSIFLGGGTPTHLNASSLERLLALVRRWFLPAVGCEFSVEANPTGLTEDKIDVLAAAGVNRASLGVQSFDPAVLRVLERDHDAATVEQVAARLRRRIENISFDLIFAVPGQSLELWKETLSGAIALVPTHVSTYGLTWEKGTAFWARREQGLLESAPEELERAMYETAIETLERAGYLQYELSNFARAGFSCRHNETYWAGLPYFGFGPGAARYIDGRREVNHRSVTTWMRRVVEGKSATGESEQLAPPERAREALAIGLRRIAGVERRAFRETTGFDLDELAGPAIARLAAAGLIENQPAGIRLTREGRFFADSVAAELV